MTKNTLLSEKNIVRTALAAGAVFFALLAILSETTYDTGDGIRHYLISRYAWAHPHMFLDSWGKPFFTIVSSPFSQFGLLGTTFFNIGCGILSAYVVYRIAKNLNYPNAILTIPFLLLAPIYFPTLNSGLTEPFFGLVLILSVYLLVEQRYLASAVLVSFLPFVRSEGFFFLPLFFIILVYQRSYLASLLLSFGTVLYSVIGFFYFNDLFWIKTQNPYNGANREAYGAGEWYSFFQEGDKIWGWLLGILLILGILCIVARIFSPKHRKDTRKFSSFLNVETVIILGGFVLFFGAHTIMWWKGLANSMGLIRVFAGVMPLSALICLRGFNLIMPNILLENKVIKASILSLVLLTLGLQPFFSDYFPFKLSQEQQAVKEAADWLKKEGRDKNKIYFLNPYLPVLLDLDALDDNKAADLWGLYPRIKTKGEGINSIPDGTIVFWDAHYGPNECGIPIDTLMNDRNFDHLKTFYPEERFTSLGGRPFTISIFSKRHTPRPSNEMLMKELAVIPYAPEARDETFNNETEYGKGLDKKVSDLPAQTMKIVFCADYKGDEAVAKEAMVVLTVDSEDGKNKLWDGDPLKVTTDSSGVRTVTNTFNVSLEPFQPTDVVKMFIWNQFKKDFIVMDKKVRYWGTPAN